MVCLTSALGIGLLVLVALKTMQWCYRVLLVTNQLDKYRRAPGQRGWAVVTGCTDGIGKAYVEELVARNFNVFMLSRTEEKLQALHKQLLDTNPAAEIRYLASDANNTDDAEFKRIAQELGDLPVTILVNNVAVSIDVPMDFSDMPFEEIDRLIRVNTIYPTKLTRALLPILKKNKPSAIINVSSAASLTPSPLISVYAGTKAYNRHFSHSLACELTPQGINVLCVIPALVSTSMTKMRPSLTVATAKSIAVNSLDKIELREVVPYWVHSLMLTMASLIPSFFNRYYEVSLLNYMQKLRERALAKRAKAKKNT